jgi:hypothetical protein
MLKAPILLLDTAQAKREVEVPGNFFFSLIFRLGVLHNGRSHPSRKRGGRTSVTGKTLLMMMHDSNKKKGLVY